MERGEDCRKSRRGKKNRELSLVLPAVAGRSKPGPDSPLGRSGAKASVGDATGLCPLQRITLPRPMLCYKMIPGCLYLH